MSHALPFESFRDFAYHLLPLHSGPHVTIRIGLSSREYRLPKALLCAKSSYFKATFENGFQETKEQSTTLEEVDGVVSTRSFEMLIQYLYCGRVGYRHLEEQEIVPAMIEFVRIADYCGVTGMESSVAESIKVLISRSPHHPCLREVENRFTLEKSDIALAANLPEGHPVRKVLAAAVVGALFRTSRGHFWNEVKEVAGLGSDLLEALTDNLRTLGTDLDKFSVFIQDPLREEMIYIH